MNFKVISFYKYVQIKNLEKIVSEIKYFCEKNSILGRILIAKEGINGAVSGKLNSIEQFKLFIEKNKLFSKIEFKEQYCKTNAYHKLVCKKRKEIVVFNHKVNLKQKGDYINPRSLKQKYDNKEDFIMLDVRNNYETRVGKFRNALTLPIQNFREFPNEIEKIKGYKNKEVIMYCTGGIRCEKASSWLKQEGFKDVKNLKGGIIEFNKHYPEEYFEGANFVFDDRLVDNKTLAIKCDICSENAMNYTNCINLECDKLFACCDNCKENLNSCCSITCKNAPRKRKIKLKKKKIGVILNYYRKNEVVLAKLDCSLYSKTEIFIKGKTTNVKEEIHEIWNEERKSIEKGLPKAYVTFKVKNTIRKNDKIFIRA